MQKFSRTNFVREFFCIRKLPIAHTMLIPNMHFLNNRTTGQKTGFRDPGHENGHKPSDEIY